MGYLLRVMIDMGKKLHRNPKTGDPWLDLLGGMIRQAVIDVEEDCAETAVEARTWLELNFPDALRMYERRQIERRARRQAAA